MKNAVARHAANPGEMNRDDAAANPPERGGNNAERSLQRQHVANRFYRNELSTRARNPAEIQVGAVERFNMRRGDSIRVCPQPSAPRAEALVTMNSYFGGELNAIRFRNRSDAGRRLAAALGRYRDQDVVVYALPRGGVVLGVEIARALNAPLDLSIPRKVGHPLNPEFGICAVTETGARVCTPEEVARVDQDWLECEIARERDEARRRRLVYLSDREPPEVKGKVAILCDDGIATGLTMRAAVQEVKYREPEHVVVAIPVIPQETAARLRQEVGSLVALDIPEFYLGAVGAYYDEFTQLTDREVIDLMNSLPEAG